MSDNLDENSLILDTNNGKIKGICENYPLYYESKPSSEENLILTWHCVPYAEPPVGNLRFKDPQPIGDWDNVRDGTKKSTACYQFERQAIEDVEFSEDSLYLKVQVPYESYVNREELLPIFVFIHGGGFIFGSAEEYDGGSLAAFGNIIVVCINYRLGIFGSLYVQGTEAKGYQSLKDQTMALKWVHENAKNFGGDPNRITICGESAGSWSVGYHLILKQSRPYFSGAILQSGCPARVDVDTSLLTPKEATQISIDIAESLGYKHKKDNSALLDFLQQLDPKKLNDKAHVISTFPIFPHDSNFFDKYPLEYLKEGDFSRIPVMAGFTDLEYLSLVYLENKKGEVKKLIDGDFAKFKKMIQNRLYLKSSDPKVDSIIKEYVPEGDINNSKVDYLKYYIDIMSDFQYKTPHLLFAELISKYNEDKMYLFEYGHKSKYSEYPAHYNGAAHAEEIPFMFANVLEEEDHESFSADDKLFCEEIASYWVNFIKFGTPTLENQWKTFDSNKSESTGNLYFLRSNETKLVETKKYSLNSKAKFWDNLNIITYRSYFDK